MPLSIHSTIRQILADERGRAVIEKHLPGASNHPQLPEALHMSLQEVSYYPEAGLTQAKLKEIDADLRALG